MVPLGWFAVTAFLGTISVAGKPYKQTYYLYHIILPKPKPKPKPKM
jgi:hypothetical protein